MGFFSRLFAPRELVYSAVGEALYSILAGGSDGDWEFSGAHDGLRHRKSGVEVTVSCGYHNDWGYLQELSVAGGNLTSDDVKRLAPLFNGILRRFQQDVRNKRQDALLQRLTGKELS